MTDDMKQMVYIPWPGTSAAMGPEPVAMTTIRQDHAAIDRAARAAAAKAMGK